MIRQPFTNHLSNSCGFECFRNSNSITEVCHNVKCCIESAFGTIVCFGVFMNPNKLV